MVFAFTLFIFNLQKLLKMRNAPVPAQRASPFWRRAATVFEPTAQVLLGISLALVTWALLLKYKCFGAKLCIEALEAAHRLNPRFPPDSLVGVVASLPLIAELPLSALLTVAFILLIAVLYLFKDRIVGNEVQAQARQLLPSPRPDARAS